MKTTCKTLLAFSLLALLFSACKMPGAGPEATPTISITQAYQTVQARLTQAVTLTPPARPSPAPTDSGVITPTATTAPTQPLPATNTALPTSPTATMQCDLAEAGNPIDVTIPDDTAMQPGQAFNKTWRLKNVGTCTWNANYKLAIFSGEAMSAPASVPLPKEVAPGQTVDLSVSLIAPQAAGSYQGNWKLRNAGDAWFGLGAGAGSPFWVRIVVTGTAATLTPTQGTPTLTPTGTPPTPTYTTVPPTLTPTLTPVPSGVRASGAPALAPGDKLDLTTGAVNGGNVDLSYEANAQGQHALIPQGAAVISLAGTAQPSREACSTAVYSAVPVIVENLGLGNYLCYRTNQGFTGRLLIVNYSAASFAVMLDFATWNNP